MAEKGKGPKTSIDFATIGGIIFAFGGIFAGLLLEGGSMKDVAQYTAALMVLGGTLGAVMITTPLNVLLRAAKQMLSIIMPKTEDLAGKIGEIIEFATIARKNGIVALETKAAAVADPFLKKALELAVDGIEPGRIRDIMELEISQFEHHADAEAKVFEAAGGYAPTIGIIGAVLGLIQVMKNLANIEEVGRGIAVSFVATIYGVAVANIFFLPAAAKLKTRAQEAVKCRELILEGILAIAEGVNQKLIKVKLDAYLESHGAKSKGEKAEAPAGAAVAAEG